MKIEQRQITKNFLIGLSVLILYLIWNNIQRLPFKLSNIEIESLSKTFVVWYSLFSSIILLLILGLIYRKTLKKHWLDLKKNHQDYFKKYFKYWFLLLVIMMGSNLIILLIRPGTIAGNEEAIRDLFSNAPLYTFISAVFLAPFLEELVFRLSFRYMFKTDWLFIITSGLIFGSMHVIGNYETPLDLLYLIPYSTPGMIFAYVLSKSNNIFVPMGLHFIHNGVLMSLQAFVSIFG
ncbi:MAG: CPBP family intramembrane metalloprotease [Bacilli bacterium]|nr:CPBP family intramembrane metalloprotease [Bacilli bacterium]MDD4809432.1 CPBP family intramembrane metalloprotease [Bacilli bacterium]